MLELDTAHGRARAHLLPVESPVAGLVLGHGAGGGIESPDLVGAAEGARSVGLSVALVEQPYRVAGRRSPARRASSTRPGRRSSSRCARAVQRPPDPDRRPLVGRPRRVPHGSRDRLGRRRLPRVPTAPTRPSREEPPRGARRRRRSDAGRPGRQRPVRDTPAELEPDCYPHPGHPLAEKRRRCCGGAIGLASYYRARNLKMAKPRCRGFSVAGL